MSPRINHVTALPPIIVPIAYNGLMFPRYTVSSPVMNSMDSTASILNALDTYMWEYMLQLYKIVVMAFENNAIAIQLDDRHSKTDIPGGKVDAVIVDFGRGTARALKHTQHMESAQAAGVPCLGLYEIDPELAREWDFDNEERWPVGLEDPHIKILDRQIYSGGQPRYVHGIILYFKKYIQSDGTKTTAGWQFMLMQHYVKTVYQYFKGKLQIYLMVAKDLVDQYPGDNQLTNYLAHQPFVSTYQSAFWMIP